VNPLNQPMIYPNRLLPQPNYKIITWHPALRKHFLIHFTTTKDLVDPITSKLKQSLVVYRTDHLRDYSNNLLGVFIVDDIYWSVQESNNKQYLLGEWNVGEGVIPPQVPTEYRKDGSRGYFFLRIDDCHEVVVPYQDATAITPVCVLLHTPINSNFWHFSLRWFCDGQDILEWDEKRRRRILTAARSFIIERAFFQEPFFEELDANLYTN